ncbi:MAG: ATP-binding cassette domain-containing protein [Turicibacter sp.]|nr:ATP-binding cassette domain-containing protein [Turicibacter sp.]
MTNPILSVRNLSKSYFSNKQFLGKKTEKKAMDQISFDLYPGETYALVGESGSGKTTTGRSILKLATPDTGEIFFEGVNLLELSDKAWRPYRKKLQMVYQDPTASLNPLKRVGKILEEPLIIHRMGTKQERLGKILDSLNAVGLSPDHLNRFPHELSGGQRQRLGIARALIMEPKIIVCDEPVSALDVSIQAQILNLLLDLQKKRGLSLFFITHDLSVARHLSDRIGVIYQGTLVEEAPTDELFSNPIHPYTRNLLASIPGKKPDFSGTGTPQEGHFVSKKYW